MPAKSYLVATRGRSDADANPGLGVTRATVGGAAVIAVMGVILAGFTGLVLATGGRSK